MNVTFFDPSFLRHDRLEYIQKAFHITEVYNLMPVSEDINSLLSCCNIPVSLTRHKDESLDSVKRRAVYKFVSKLSKPIIVGGDWIGECIVADIYKESKNNCFKNNLMLNDPNILILKQFGAKENSSIRMFYYIFNILKKYSQINYKRRLCIETLSKFITYDYGMSIFGTLPKILSDYCLIKDPNELAEFFLTKEGIEIRKKLILQIQEKDNDWGQDDDNDWGQDAEMDYIRNNGGDWIDD